MRVIHPSTRWPKITKKVIRAKMQYKKLKSDAFKAWIDGVFSKAGVQRDSVQQIVKVYDLDVLEAKL